MTVPAGLAALCKHMGRYCQQNSTQKIHIFACFLAKKNVEKCRPNGDELLTQRAWVSAAATMSTSHSATLQPSAARASQIARPIPVPPPVTTPSIPLKEDFMTYRFYGGGRRQRPACQQPAQSRRLV